MAREGLLIGALFIISGVWAEYNFTYNMAQRCKEHISSEGYHYSPFYRVAERVTTQMGVVYELHVAILAASNGHVLLSPVEAPKPEDHVYEIVLGGAANRFSEIRRQQRRRAKATVRSPGLLSAIHFRAFWIRLTDEGAVEVGQEGESLPFLSWEDPDPLPVNYFSFASWTNVEAKFLYECPLGGEDSSENATGSEAVMPTLTTAQQLKASLLDAHAPLTAPAPRVNVNVAISIVSLQYHVQRSVLDTLLGVVLVWQDKNLAWNPDLYNGTTELVFRQSEIWKPQFYVHNSVGTGDLQPKTMEPVYILSSGKAVMHIRAKVSTWCEDDGDNALSAWPRDRYRCDIFIRPWQMSEEIYMEMVEPGAIENEENQKESELVSNEWELSGAGADYVTLELGAQEQSPLHNVTCVGDEDAPGVRALRLSVAVRRRGAVGVALYTPLIAVAVFLLMSFCWAPLAPGRVQFYACAVTLLCALLCYIDAMVPTRATPSVVLLYCAVLMSALLAMVVRLVLTHPALDSWYSSGRFPACSSKFLRFICCLPPVKTYTSFSDESEDMVPKEPEQSSSDGTRRSEQLETEAEERGPKYEAVEVADRAMFALFAVLYAVLFASHY